MQLDRLGQSAVTRARRLAELTDAIENAQQLAWKLANAERPSEEARELFGRLEAARLEVEKIRCISARTPIAEPAWLRPLGWSGALLDPAD